MLYVRTSCAAQLKLCILQNKHQIFCDTKDQRCTFYATAYVDHNNKFGYVQWMVPRDISTDCITIDLLTQGQVQVGHRDSLCPPKKAQLRIVGQFSL